MGVTYVTRAAEMGIEGAKYPWFSRSKGLIAPNTARPKSLTALYVIWQWSIQAITTAINKRCFALRLRKEFELFHFNSITEGGSSAKADLQVVLH